MKYLHALALTLLFFACGQGENSPATDAAAEQTTGSEEWIQDDFSAAMTLAAETGKPIFIDMYADWCGPCRMLAEDYFTRDDYKEVLSQCVLLKINIDNFPDIADEYGVQSIPTLILSDADGNEIDRITGVMGSPEEFLPVLSDLISKGL
jgi:thiol:disulfide interchange protein